MPSQIPEISQDDLNSLNMAAEYELMRTPINDVRQLSLINRFHMTVPEGHLGMKGFIFMTRPNMNLFKVKTNTLTRYEVECDKINEDLGRLATFNYIFNLGRNEDQKDSGKCWLGKRIFASLEHFGVSSSSKKPWSDGETNKINGPWLSIVTNQANGYSPIDREMDVVAVSDTFHGNKVQYAEPTFKHKIGGTITIDFTDRRDLSLFYTLKLWIEYMQAVTTGLASPFRKYIGMGILDYAASIYYVVTDETMENIIYWEKLTGVFPLSVPDSLFSTAEGTNSKDLKYSINFAYSMRSVQHESHLMEINALYSVTSDDYRFNMNAGKFAVGTSVGSPKETLVQYVERVRKNYSVSEDDKKVIENTYGAIARLYGSTITYDDANKYFYVLNNKSKSQFYANYIPNANIHGVPYVHGPFITLGSLGTTDYKGNDGTANKGHYKLRWI